MTAFAAPSRDPVSIRRASRRAADQALALARAEFITAADHPQAADEADALTELAEQLAADVSGWIAALRRIDPALALKGGRRLATADHCDWLEQTAQDLAQPMTAAAARLFLAAARRAGL